jgi:hypothetical protein
VLGGRPLDDVHIYRHDARRVDTLPSLAEPAYRPKAVAWPLRPGWMAVGCGFTDDDERDGVDVIELLDPTTGGSLPPMELDRERPGCVLSALDDGALLVTGGWTLRDVVDGEPSGVHAAIIVPYASDAR